MKNSVEIVHDLDGKSIVMIHDIRFKGKRKIKWVEVELYLREYIGNHFEIIESADVIYIGSDFPDEFSNSNYSAKIRGTLAKAKANAAQAIGEIIEVAWNKEHTENREEKHKNDAKYGWYRYYSRFALPVYATDGSIERYNVFHVQLIVRHDKKGKMYLYDLINLKKEKEPSTPLCLLRTVKNPIPLV